MQTRYLAFNEKFLFFLTVFASFSIALSTAFMSLSMGFFVIIWAISLNYAKKFQLIRNNPAALISLALFCLYGIGMIYSSASWEIRLSWWLNYHKLLYIPMIVGILTIERYRRFALHAYLAGMLMVLLISYLKWMGIVPHTDIGQGYFVFKGRIAHNIFMAFTMYLMLRLSVQSSNLIRLTWILLSILAIFNIFFLVNGRTGQIITPILLGWFFWETWGFKSIKWIITAVITMLVTFFTLSNFTNISGIRLAEIRQEILNHKPNEAPTSSGIRLEFYKNALELIKQKPVFGGGTGSFEAEYRLLAETKKTISTYVPNPHNEFLLTWQELGTVGLVMLLAFFAIQWRISYRIDSEEEEGNKIYGYALRGLIITILIGSLFNSLLLDAGEGKFYCVLAGVFLSAYQSKKQRIV